MTEKLHRAKEKMLRDDDTCVAIKADTMYTSKERGVKPLLVWLESGVDMQDASVADKVVGKAAAFLYVKLQIKELYAGVISTPACAVLERHGISVEYGKKVDVIENRTHTGYCPMETATLAIEDADEALVAIKKTASALAKQI